MREMTPAQHEDREYVEVDLRLPVEQQCGHELGRYGRVCSRRADHVNERHRSGEVSWTDEMATRA